MFKTKENVCLRGAILFLFLTLCGEGWSQGEDITLTEAERTVILYAPTKQVEDSISKYYTYGSYDLLFKYSSHYLERGIRENNDAIKYMAHYNLADFYYYSKYTDLKKHYFHANATLQAAEILEEPAQIIQALHIKGSALEELGQYKDAFKDYYRSLTLSKEHKLLVSEIRSRTYLGHIKIRLEEFVEGIHIHEDILNLLEQQIYKERYKDVDYYEIYINVLNGLGICQRDVNDNQMAINTFKKGLSFLESQKVYSPGLKFIIQTNLGKAYANLGNYTKAEAYLNESKDFFSERLNKSNGYFQNVFFRSELLKKQGKSKEALLLLEESFEYLNENEFPPKLLYICDLAINLSKDLNDKEKENKYHRIKTNAIEAIHSNKTEARRLENEELSQENKTLTSENIKTNTILKKTIILIGILSLFIFGLSFLYVRKNILNKKKFDLLVAKMNRPAEEKDDTPVTLTIADEKTKVILEKLQKLEKKYFFIHQDCTLHNTAKKLKTNTTYLSKIINTHKQKTFNEYLNEYRINYVLRQINESSKFRMYTISAIAQELGYKSTNTFTNAFKKHTGLNPSFYIKQIGRNKKAS